MFIDNIAEYGNTTLKDIACPMDLDFRSSHSDVNKDCKDIVLADIDVQCCWGCTWP